MGGGGRATSYSILGMCWNLCPVVLIFVFFFIFLSFFLKPSSSEMGNAQLTPLSLTLTHWKDKQDTTSNHSVTVKNKMWVTLWTDEWPMFIVGLPASRIFDAATIHQEEEIILCPCGGYPDQVPYIVTWPGLIDRMEGSLPWITFLVTQWTQDLVAKTRTPPAGTK